VIQYLPAPPRAFFLSRRPAAAKQLEPLRPASQASGRAAAGHYRCGQLGIAHGHKLHGCSVWTLTKAPTVERSRRWRSPHVTRIGVVRPRAR
jgi:hypothetical protein